MGRLKIIGAGTPSPNPDRWGTCFLLESRDGWLMVDCGPGSTYKMFRAGVSPTHIQHLFFTHLHSDHVSDYACFLMTRFDHSIGVEGDLHVYGPPPIRDLTERLWTPGGALWFDVIARTNHPMSLDAYQKRGGKGERPVPVVHAEEYDGQDVVSGNGWRCFTREVQHAQPWLQCHGLRFETDEGVVAFSGDTAPVPAVVELARDADLFVMEASRLEKDLRKMPAYKSESSAAGAGRMAAEAGVKRLVVNHQSDALDRPDQVSEAIHEIKSIYDGPVTFAKDLMEVEW